MTILTKNSSCDDKEPVKIAIPPLEEVDNSETPLNNNTIVYADHYERKRRNLLLIISSLLICLSLIMFIGVMNDPMPRSGTYLKRLRCDIGEDGVPHIRELDSEDLNQGAYFPFSVRVFRVWLPNIFDNSTNESTDDFDDDMMNNEFFKPDAFFGGSHADGDIAIPQNDNSEENNHMFREELSLNNKDSEQILTVDFLDFKNGRSGRFIHALSANQTAIVDKTNNRCFVMPLDPDTDIIPQDVLNMSSDKDLNTERVRKNMEIITPKLEDLTELSPKIQQQCKGMNVYKLEKHNSELFKRDLEKVERFQEVAGKKWIDLNIIGADRLE